jgi:hypothetical protein
MVFNFAADFTVVGPPNSSFPSLHGVPLPPPDQEEDTNLYNLSLEGVDDLDNSETETDSPIGSYLNPSSSLRAQLPVSRDYGSYTDPAVWNSLSYEKEPPALAPPPLPSARPDQPPASRPPTSSFSSVVAPEYWTQTSKTSEQIERMRYDVMRNLMILDTNQKTP